MDNEANLRPTAPTIQASNSSIGGNRQTIDIDERNDTVHNGSDLDRILQRGRRL